MTLRYRSKLHHIGVGRLHRGKSVILLIDGLDIRIVSQDGAPLRRLTLDPTSNSDKPVIEHFSEPDPRYADRSNQERREGPLKPNVLPPRDLRHLDQLFGHLPMPRSVIG